MNIIELVEKYLPVLDEQYRAESRSAILDYPAEWIEDTKDAKKIKIAKMRVDKLGNYSRANGFVKGSADLTWEEHEFTQDRGRSIQVDHMDNQETFGMAFGRLAGRFQKDAIIPELDAYRFATYYQKAGTKLTFKVESNAILKLIDNLDAQMEDDEVGDDTIMFTNPQVFNFMINDPQIVKHISVLDSSDKTINKKIYMYDNHMIVKVPSKRFYTAITQYDGTTDGQKEGGYVPAEGAQVIGLMLISPYAVVQISKRAVARIWAPSRELAAGTDGVNPDADAWKFDFRVYHDAWVLDEKIAGIAAAIVEGENTTALGNVSVSAVSGATYVVNMQGSTVLFNGVIPYEDADAQLGLDAGNRINITFKNANIASKDALPSGVICRTLKSDGTFNEYTKDAFEADGSLNLVANINSLRVGLTEIKWTANETISYVTNTLGATLEPAE